MPRLSRRVAGWGGAAVDGAKLLARNAAGGGVEYFPRLYCANRPRGAKLEERRCVSSLRRRNGKSTDKDNMEFEGRVTC